MNQTSGMIVLISDWIDSNNADEWRDNATLALYGRITKVMEEYGEVLEAVISHDTDSITRELADVTLTAFCAWYHITPDRVRLAQVMHQTIAETICSDGTLAVLDWDIYRTLAPLGITCGKTMQILIGATGQNPRKGFTHAKSDVGDCLVSVAREAMSAVNEITGDPSAGMMVLADKIDAVMARAGLAV